MKNKLLYLLLALTGAVCAALSLSGVLPALSAAGLAAFPLSQAAALIRALSGGGALGRAAGLALYAAICIAPAWAAFFLSRKNRLCAWDIAFFASSALLFAAMYFLINPQKAATVASNAAGIGDIYAVMLSTAALSLLLCGILGRAARACLAAGKPKLCSHMSALITLLCFVIVAAVCGVQLASLAASIRALAANAAAGALDYAFAALTFLVAALPLALDMVIALMARGLFKCLATDGEDNGAAEAAGKLARMCARALVVVALSQAAFNVLQLLLANSLVNMNASVSVPITSFIVLLATLLFARVVEENRTLRADNELFI